MTSLAFLMMLPGGGSVSVFIYLLLLYTVPLLSMRDAVRLINNNDFPHYHIHFGVAGGFPFLLAVLFYMYFSRKLIRPIDLSDAPAVFIPVFVFLSSVFFCDEIYAFFFMNKIKSLENEREMVLNEKGTFSY